MGSLVSLFLTSGDVSSGFQSHSGHPYSNLAEAKFDKKVFWLRTIIDSSPIGDQLSEQ